MSTDFSHKEREFVAGLQAQTGRNLPDWMAAIANSGLAHRNDIIDWLRQHGFSFARASWLERIHHNGGRLIYESHAPASTRRKSKASGSPPLNLALSPSQLPPSQPTASPPRADADLDQLLSAAKAYRPLAQVILREILAAVPGADASPAGDHILISHADPFAALTPSSKDVKLYLALGTKPFDGHWIKARITGAQADKLALLTHMIVLTDARQLMPDLEHLIKTSARACSRRNH
jgi:Domain of unknown function (DUF5655)